MEISPTEASNDFAVEEAPRHSAKKMLEPPKKRSAAVLIPLSLNKRPVFYSNPVTTALAFFFFIFLWNRFSSGWKMS